MTNSQSQANTLSILLWVYAGIQSLFALLFILLILIYGASGIFSLVGGGKDAAAGVAVSGVIVFIYVVILAICVTSIILNIRAGSRLKQPMAASKNLLLGSAIMNLVSCLGGGFCLAPLGIAMGVYGLYFALSDVGTNYFRGVGGGFHNPPPINQYGPGTFGNYEP